MHPGNVSSKILITYLHPTPLSNTPFVLGLSLGTFHLFRTLKPDTELSLALMITSLFIVTFQGGEKMTTAANRGVNCVAEMSHSGTRTTRTKSTHTCTTATGRKKLVLCKFPKMTCDSEVIIGPCHEVLIYDELSKNLLELPNIDNFIQSKYRNLHSTRSNT